MIFYKYSGSGNRFFLIEDKLPEKSVISYLCKRFEIDGLIHLSPSEKADIKMRVFNADTSEADMCGNALRSVIKHLNKNASVETLSGVLNGTIQENMVTVQLTAPKNFHEIFGGYFINTGVPHFVAFTEDIDHPDLMDQAPKIRNHPQFQPEGVNVTFASILADRSIKTRTYEKGVERETGACGTGAAAAAIVAHQAHQLIAPMTVIPSSGEELIINFSDDYQDVTLTGSVAFLGQGSFEVSTTAS